MTGQHLSERNKRNVFVDFENENRYYLH